MLLQKKENLVCWIKKRADIVKHVTLVSANCMKTSFLVSGARWITTERQTADVGSYSYYFEENGLVSEKCGQLDYGSERDRLKDND